MSFPKKSVKSIPKSDTSYNLPALELPYQTSINKKSRIMTKQKAYLSSRSLVDNNKSYLEQLEKLNLKSEYEEIDFGYLNSEQKKLKSLLKKMNVDTFKLVQSYKNKPKKSSKQVKRTISQMQMINQQEELTNAKLIQILHYQIKKLQERSEHLITNNLSKDHYLQKIEIIKKQIFSMKSVNFVQKHQITKISKTLQIQNDHEEQKNNIQRLQNQFKAILTKKYKFQAQQKRIIEQEVKLKQNNKNLSQKLKQLKSVPEYEIIISRLSQKNKGIIKSQIISEPILNEKQIQTKPQNIIQNKKQYLQALKKKNQSINERNQQKYFRILKQIQHISNNNLTADQKITQIQGKILQSKELMRQKQFKLFDLKQRKRMQVNQLNEFLINSRLQQIDQPSQKLKHFKNETQHQSQMLDQNEFQEKKSHTQKDVNVNTIKLLKSENPQINPQQSKQPIIVKTQSKMV